MKTRLMILGLFVVSFLTLAPAAQAAGVLRDAGSGIAKGTTVVAQTAASGTQAVANGATTAASATSDAVKSGASTTWDGVKAAPAAVAHGTTHVAKAAWHVIW